MHASYKCTLSKYLLEYPDLDLASKNIHVGSIHDSTSALARLLLVAIEGRGPPTNIWLLPTGTLSCLPVR